MERLPHASAAGANDERRPADAELVEGIGRRELALLGREGLRRLGAVFLFHEQCAAAGAVVRSLRVLEAALLAVDMAQVTSAARSSTSGFPSGGRRPPVRGRFCPASSAAVRRAPRGGCRSSRAGAAAGTRSRA